MFRNKRPFLRDSLQSCNPGQALKYFTVPLSVRVRNCEEKINLQNKTLIVDDLN